MIYGYVRVSTRDQKLDRQIDALREYGKPIDRVYSDKQSGKDFCREGYLELKSVVREGDEVVIKELDRLGRNKVEVKKELEWFRSAGVVVRILDLPTSLIEFGDQAWVQDMVNNILVEVLAALAEQERRKNHERQAEGYAAKRARGEWSDIGRPRKEPAGFAEVLERQRRGECSVAEACAALGISRGTWYRLRSA